MLSRQKVKVLLLLIPIVLGTILPASAAFGSGPETLTVALTGKYPPFSFYDNKGELAGFDVDVSRAIADRLGLKLRIVTTEWDGILAGLLAGGAGCFGS